MSLRGGYLICDLKGKDVNTSQTIDGIYEKLEGNLGKPVLVSGIVINDVDYKDCYCAMSVDGTDIILSNAGYKFTITDQDAVTGVVYDQDEISNKKIYYHPIYITDSASTFTLTWAILDNKPTAYTKDEMLVKLKALLDLGAIIQVNGWFVYSSEMHNVYMMYKENDEYRIYGNCEAIPQKFRSILLNTTWEDISLFVDGVNAIN